MSVVHEAGHRRLPTMAREPRKEDRQEQLRMGEETVQVKIRWGLPGDKAQIAELLEMNGFPRRIATEEKFMVAERDGTIQAALSSRTGAKRFLLGLLVADPWIQERPLTVALYAGARTLAREVGVEEVRARPLRYGGYAYEAGYRRVVGGWRLDVEWPPNRRGELPAGGLRKRITLLGTWIAPHFRALKRGERKRAVSAADPVT